MLFKYVNHVIETSGPTQPPRFLPPFTFPLSTPSTEELKQVHLQNHICTTWIVQLHLGGSGTATATETGKYFTYRYLGFSLTIIKFKHQA